MEHYSKYFQLIINQRSISPYEYVLFLLDEILLIKENKMTIFFNVIYSFSGNQTSYEDSKFPRLTHRDILCSKVNMTVIYRYSDLTMYI